MQAITCAVVGVILNLSIWFALHVLFDRVIHWGALPMPDLSSINETAVILTLIAAAMMLWLKRGLGLTLLTMATIGAGLGLLYGAI